MVRAGSARRLSVVARRAPASPKDVRLLALLEAEYVTGPVKNLLAFAREAREGSGLELRIAAFRRGGRTPEPLAAALDAAGIERRWIDERHRYDPRIFAQVREIARDWRIDLVQTHSVKSHFVVRASGLYRARPWIAFHHGYTRTDLKMRLYNLCDRWSLRTARTVVTVSRAAAVQLERIGLPGTAVHIVPNEPDRRQPPHPIEPPVVRRALGVPDEAPLILSVGRLSPEKGHHVLLRAMAEAGRNGTSSWSGARLILAGEGPERPALSRSIRRLGLDGRVLLLGHRSDVPALLASADLFVLPSLSEGCPNALLEALQAGVPVVASDIGGVREMVENGRDAVLVTANDARALSRAVAKLLADREDRHRLARRGRERLKGCARGRTSQLLELYAGLASRALADSGVDPSEARL
jgi:glycosyltransferase involved in cell wall biosynthesis